MRESMFKSDSNLNSNFINFAEYPLFKLNWCKRIKKFKFLSDTSFQKGKY